MVARKNVGPFNALNERKFNKIFLLLDILLVCFNKKKYNNIILEANEEHDDFYRWSALVPNVCMHGR